MVFSISNGFGTIAHDRRSLGRSSRTDTLVMHGDDDQVVPDADAAPLSVERPQDGRLKTFSDLPFRVCTTHPDCIGADLLQFVRD